MIKKGKWSKERGDEIKVLIEDDNSYFILSPGKWLRVLDGKRETTRVYKIVSVNIENREYRYRVWGDKDKKMGKLCKGKAHNSMRTIEYIKEIKEGDQFFHILKV